MPYYDPDVIDPSKDELKAVKAKFERQWPEFKVDNFQHIYDLMRNAIAKELADHDNELLALKWHCDVVDNRKVYDNCTVAGRINMLISKPQSIPFKELFEQYGIFANTRMPLPENNDPWANQSVSGHKVVQDFIFYPESIPGFSELQVYLKLQDKTFDKEYDFSHNV